mmetsp:Transcript_102274/g.324945  ORF Transcript_102274/g.324945 Transcript_102274/m.324945 type:complete len:276 (+) Transcript_102274:518-1345(+)
MGVDRAPAGVGVRQHGEALEAEACVAVAAEHLVALRPLRLLILQVLLGHPHAAGGALLRAGLLEPLHEAVLVPLLPLALQTPPCSILLARHTPVVRLRGAPKARVLLAQRAPQSWHFSVTESHAHRAVRGWACPEVGRGGDRLLQAPREQAVNELRGQQLPQVSLRKWGGALGARHAGGAHLETGLGVSQDALRAVPAVPAAQPDSPPGRCVVATDLAGLSAAVDPHGARARARGRDLEARDHLLALLLQLLLLLPLLGGLCRAWRRWWTLGHHC